MSAVLADRMSFCAKNDYFVAMDTISPVYARVVLREVEQREIDSSTLFERTALDREELLHGGDIGLPDFLQILQNGDRLLGDEELGFLLGRKTHVFGMGPVGSGMAVAPNLRQGLQLLETFTRLHATYIAIDARSTTRGLTVSIVYEQQTGYAERIHTETAMMLLQQYVETLVGEAARDVLYRFAMAVPDNCTDYVNALHGILVFDADANEVEIPQRWLDLPSPYYHAELWQQAQIGLAQTLREKGRRQGTPYTQHVTTLLSTSEPPLPNLSEVAFGLHVSVRTLNRHLQAENTTFRQLKSRALASRAKLYLRDSNLSVEAIGETLGYQDTANFRRAFRRSVGCSPMEYRMAVQAGC
jgi:AraC-like DNA-binding protein